MSKPLRIVVADDEPDMRDYFRAVLPVLGHEVVGAAESGDELLRICDLEQPDLVITDIKMPGLDGIEAVSRVAHLAPTILVSAYHDEALLQRVGLEQIVAFLVKPIKQSDLEPAIAIAMKQFLHSRQLREEATRLRQELENRKVIERAKGLLMKKTGLSEPDAFRRLQKLASDQNRKLVDAAHMLLDADAAFRR